jgi:hypothetical protein
MDREDVIRRRAYEIWEDEGRPEGLHQEHWGRAERELNGSHADENIGDAPNTGKAELKTEMRPTEMQPSQTASAGTAEKPATGKSASGGTGTAAAPVRRSRASQGANQS